MAAKVKKVDGGLAADWRHILLDSAKGAIMGCLATVVAVVLFALAIQLFNIGDGAIPVVNTVIKVLSLVLAAGFALWVRPSHGWIKGIVCGVLYTVVLYAAFALVDGMWAINWAVAVDVTVSALIGAVAGILTVNVRLKIR